MVPVRLYAQTMCAYSPHQLQMHPGSLLPWLDLMNDDRSRR